MIITDTHTHLYTEDFDADRDQVIQRAMNEGITRFFLPAIDSHYSERMRSLKAAYPKEIFLMTGLHPTHVKEDYYTELDHVYNQLQTNDYIAIGEIGIDLYWDTQYLLQQKQAFITQIRWAKEYRLPIVIHSRNSFSEIFEILESEQDGSLKGVLHCFTGDENQACRGIELGMMLGIGGVLTFKNSGLHSFLGKIDLNHILLETDSPYLAPVPHRGKRNESSYLIQIIERIGQVYDLDIPTIARRTTENSIRLFGC